MSPVDRVAPLTQVKGHPWTGKTPDAGKMFVFVGNALDQRPLAETCRVNGHMRDVPQLNDGEMVHYVTGQPPRIIALPPKPGEPA